MMYPVSANTPRCVLDNVVQTALEERDVPTAVTLITDFVIALPEVSS